MRPARVVLGLLLWSATVAAQQYVISTYAGGAPPPTPVLGVDVPISGAGVATDAAGNAYFTSLRCVFKLDQQGIVTRIAGNSRAGYSGDGGVATSAQLASPTAVPPTTTTPQPPAANNALVMALLLAGGLGGRKHHDDDGDDIEKKDSQDRKL